MKVVFRAVAEAEVTDAWEYYEAIAPDLADDFLQRVEEALGHALERPLVNAAVHGDLRIVRLGRFPHLIVYRVVGDELVVVACTHPRQRTERWSGRR